MDEELILIRYGELSLKSTYVRRRFESILTQNILHMFRSHMLPCTIRKEWGRIYLYTDPISSGIPLLQKIFGITSVSPAVETTNDFQDITHHAVRLIKKS
ncbi:MAG: hypothetical protein V1726_00800 [Methanobacteriota archaeon]